MDAMTPGNSEDFSEEDAAAAIAVEHVDGVIEHLKKQQCGCGHPLFPTSQQQRRKDDVLYWRVLLACSRMHEETLVFKVRSHQPG